MQEYPLEPRNSKFSFVSVSIKIWPRKHCQAEVKAPGVRQDFLYLLLFSTYHNPGLQQRGQTGQQWDRTRPEQTNLFLKAGKLLMQWPLCRLSVTTAVHQW